MTDTTIIEQGSPEWHAARLGKVTASRISCVMANGRSGKPSATRANYMAELICETLTGNPAPSFTSAAMEWGNDKEEEAAEYYAFMSNAELLPCGFYDHPTIVNSGASPDRLIGEDALAEIKCPNTATHLAFLQGKPIKREYLLQMQWQMACTGRKHNTFISYDPRLPDQLKMKAVTVKRDLALISEISQAVKSFQEEMQETLENLEREYGK